MKLLTAALYDTLRANAERRHQAQHARRGEPDPVPVVKLFNPVGAATWIATELDDDGDTLFGLTDLGFGCPELGSFSLREIAALRLPFGLSIERDLQFEGMAPLSVWADTARRAGSISAAEPLIRAGHPAPDPELPQSGPDCRCAQHLWLCGSCDRGREERACSLVVVGAVGLNGICDVVGARGCLCRKGPQYL